MKESRPGSNGNRRWAAYWIGDGKSHHQEASDPGIRLLAAPLGVRGSHLQPCFRPARVARHEPRLSSEKQSAQEPRDITGFWVWEASILNSVG